LHRARKTLPGGDIGIQQSAIKLTAISVIVFSLQPAVAHRDDIRAGYPIAYQ